MPTRAKGVRVPLSFIGASHAAVPLSDGVQEREQKICDSLAELSWQELLLERQAARAEELSTMRHLRAALAALERENVAGPAALRALRERARTMSFRLDELEEVQEEMISTPSSREALQMRMRASMMAERSTCLAEMLRRTTEASVANADAWHEPRGSQEQEEATLLAMRAQLDAAVERDAWQEMRGMAQGLMDATEEARRAISELEITTETRAAAGVAARAATAAKARAQSESLRAELAGLTAQAEALRRSQSDETRRKLEAAGRRDKEESRLRAEITSMRLAIDRLAARKAELVDAARVRREQRDLQAAEAERQRAAAPAAAAKRRAVPKLGAKPASGAARLDAAQRERLEALKAKYGAHVAERASERVGESHSTSGDALR